MLRLVAGYFSSVFNFNNVSNYDRGQFIISLNFHVEVSNSLLPVQFRKLFVTLLIN